MSESFGQDSKKLLQAVVLADADMDPARFRPFSATTPKVLLPIAGVPMIEYSLEALALAGVEQIFIVTCPQQEAQLKRYETRWPHRHNVSIEVIKAPATTIGDALRTLGHLNKLTGDFVLISGDVVTNAPIRALIDEHKARFAADPTVTMTMAFSTVRPGHAMRSPEDDLIVGMNPRSHELIVYSNDVTSDSLLLPLHSLQRHEAARLRYDLVDAHIAVCGAGVLTAFCVDNVDYVDLRAQYVRNAIDKQDSDLMNEDKVCAHIFPQVSYSSRVTDWRTFHTVTHDVLRRWVAPFTPDANLLGNTAYAYVRGAGYRPLTGSIVAAASSDADAAGAGAAAAVASSAATLAPSAATSAPAGAPLPRPQPALARSLSYLPSASASASASSTGGPGSPASPSSSSSAAAAAGSYASASALSAPALAAALSGLSCAAAASGPFIVHAGVTTDRDCLLSPNTTLGPRARLSKVIACPGVAIGADAVVTSSYLFAGASVGAGAVVEGAVLGRGVVVGAGARVCRGALLGDGVVIAAGHIVPPYACLVRADVPVSEEEKTAAEDAAAFAEEQAERAAAAAAAASPDVAAAHAAGALTVYLGAGDDDDDAPAAAAGAGLGDDSYDGPLGRCLLIPAPAALADEPLSVALTSCSARAPAVAAAALPFSPFAAPAALAALSPAVVSGSGSGSAAGSSSGAAGNARVFTRPFAPAFGPAVSALLNTPCPPAAVRALRARPALSLDALLAEDEAGFGDDDDDAGLGVITRQVVPKGGFFREIAATLNERNAAYAAPDDDQVDDVVFELAQLKLRHNINLNWYSAAVTVGLLVAAGFPEPVRGPSVEGLGANTAAAAAAAAAAATKFEVSPAAVTKTQAVALRSVCTKWGYALGKFGQRASDQTAYILPGILHAGLMHPSYAAAVKHVISTLVGADELDAACIVAFYDARKRALTDGAEEDEDAGVSTEEVMREEPAEAKAALAVSLGGIVELLRQSLEDDDEDEDEDEDDE